MQDQVEKVWELGFEAAQISSLQSDAENNKAMSDWESGILKFLFVAPERLQVDRFLQSITTKIPDLLVVDEAHCISQWADTFRPDYTKIGFYTSMYSPKCVLAITATATNEVEEDIRNILGIPEAKRVVYLPDRSNLKFHIKGKPSGREILKDLESVDGSVIVYCSTHANVENLFYEIGHRVTGGSLIYHGGMDSNNRSSNQNLFMSGHTRVMFATNAFGMGIDKSDIRGIIHRDLPSSLEDYVQETGRAGRDESQSQCIAYLDDKAVSTQMWFVETSFPPEFEVRRLYDHLKRVADENGIVKATISSIAKKIGQHDAVTNSCFAILISNEVIDRMKPSNKIGLIRIHKEHVSDNYNNTLDSIEDVGIMNDEGWIEFDLVFAAERSGKKAATLRNILRTLDKEKYISFVAPFTGKITKLKKDVSEVDFERLAVKRSRSVEKLNNLIGFLKRDNTDKHKIISEYFL
jgi:superfamily II DNA helicase RecQ